MENMKYFLDLKNFRSKNSYKYLQVKQVLLFSEKVSAYLKAVKPITSTVEYDELMQGIILLHKNYRFIWPNTFSIYNREKIAIGRSKPLTEKTTWGGVSLKQVDTERNFVKKLLVIKQYGVLGFELHKRKNEELKIMEGLCIILHSNHASPDWKNGRICISFSAPGDIFEFLPNDEHGILALTHCVIEEKSTNHLDDLHYIFAASQFR